MKSHAGSEFKLRFYKSEPAVQPFRVSIRTDVDCVVEARIRRVIDGDVVDPKDSLQLYLLVQVKSRVAICNLW